MSYAAERWARAQRVGNARAKQVLVELANCHNGKTGKCTPGIKYLHEVTELKEDTISTATNFLQSKGFIKKTYVAVEKGRAISYELLGFNPQEWERKKTEDSTENGLTPNRGNPESVGTPETGATDSPENGGTVPPNSGVKQGIRTGKGTGKLCARLPALHNLRKCLTTKSPICSSPCRRKKVSAHPLKKVPTFPKRVTTLLRLRSASVFPTSKSPSPSPSRSGKTSPLSERNVERRSPKRPSGEFSGKPKKPASLWKPLSLPAVSVVGRASKPLGTRRTKPNRT